MKLVVNADDLGMASAVNNAILLAFEKGLISSASIMANMPGFEEACALVRSHGLNGKIGVHLNLIEGRPLTSEITNCPRFCNDKGFFSKRSLKGAIHLSQKELRAVKQEVRCQIQACINNGITPTHLDSHHHYHFSWAIGSAVIRVAKEKNIPAIRLNGIYTPETLNIGPIRKFYQAVYNARLFFSGLAKTRYSCSLACVPAFLEKQKGIVEVVVHPRLDESGRLIDLQYKNELKPLIEQLGRHELVPYPG